MTANHIDAEVTAIAKRYRALGEVIAQLAEERTALQNRMRDLVPVGYALTVGDKTAAVQPPAREFSLDLALEVARVAGIAPRFESVVDTADLKARLKAAGKLDDAMRPGAGAARVVLG